MTFHSVPTGSSSRSLEQPPPMPGRVYPPAPVTAVGYGARGHKDSIPAYTAEVPNLVYAPNVGGASYDKEPALADVRAVLRTPSPTPSEVQVLASKTKLLGDWRRFLNWRRYANARSMMIIAGLIAFHIIIILAVVFKKDIIKFLQPMADWLNRTTGAWAIPIAVIFLLSFPPLAGQEVVAIWCGNVWGVWVGFGIVAAGTIVGELAAFYAVKTFCLARGKQQEEKKLKWALRAQVVREGGFVLPTMLRLTFLPGHFLTAFFSACGMSVWTFLVAMTLSLPKQLGFVYLGVGLDKDEEKAITRGIKAGVTLALLVMTFITMRYVNKKVDEVKDEVIYARRKARQAGVLRGGARDEELAFRPAGSQEPLAPGSSSTGAGAAIYMPAPQRPREAGKLVGGHKKRASDAGSRGRSIGIGAGNEMELGDRREFRS
ncbi:uncharacterized protein TRAVEDRAFT_72909 [Trametes versicolor FP-101664 SS1]|uniref:uncharacterized protein n=1 Tax=Trametes versicolor (strain FP-101664) TaxID=717944 RepID=UPI00046222FC|nr:uncharacterized protein TRAVEDRAFT_72909 [Trametes versicolor FP-101664 SS1]EIW58051.1 hypothetical protein TRAVEDRAFT_72909 [Trametes versicolor FP-101664 SS1]